MGKTHSFAYKSFNGITHYFLWLFLLSLSFSLQGCTNKRTSESEKESKTDTVTLSINHLSDEGTNDDTGDAFAFMDEFGFEVDENFPMPALLSVPEKVPSDIPAYFTDLMKMKVAKPVVRFPENGEREIVFQTLQKLQDYAIGKRKFYPKDEVNQCIHILYSYHCYDSGHNGEDYPNPELRLVQNYLRQFVGIAALLCPDIDFLSDKKDAQATIGLRQFMDWGHTYVTQSFVFIPHGKDVHMQIIEELNSGFIEKIFHLTDKQGREYYLFSNDSDAYRFNQILFVKENGRIQHVVTYADLFEYEPVGDYLIFFNPRTLSWNFCEHKNSDYHKIQGTITVKLHLDGMKSKFELVK